MHVDTSFYHSLVALTTVFMYTSDGTVRLHRPVWTYGASLSNTGKLQNLMSLLAIVIFLLFKQLELSEKYVSYLRPRFLKYKRAIFVLITLSSREGSDEPSHTRRLARAFASRILKSMDIDKDSDKNLDI